MRSEKNYIKFQISLVILGLKDRMGSHTKYACNFIDLRIHSHVHVTITVNQ